MADSVNAIEVIVKVGNNTNLSFSHCKAYRAITAEEVVMLHNKVKSCNIIIIERIKSEENNLLRDFINEYVADDVNSVWFHIPDEDEATLGLADELNYDVYLNKKDLFKAIYDSTGLNLSTDIDFRKSLYSEDTMYGFDSDSVFEDLTPAENSEIKEEKVESIEDKKISLENIEETETTLEEALEVADDVDNIEVENIEIEVENIEIEVEKEEKITLTKDDNNIDTELVAKLRNENKELLDTIKEANSRNSDLIKLNRALKLENKNLVDEYNAVVSNDTVLENPISLQEYKELKETNEESLNKIEKLKESIGELEKDGESKQNTIDTLESELNETKGLLEASKEQINTLNEQIQDNSEKDHLIKELTSGNEDKARQLNSRKEEIDKLHTIISTNAESIEAETNARLNSIEFTNLALQEIERINAELLEKENKIENQSEIINSLKSFDNSNNDTIKRQAEEIVSLREKAKDIDSKIEEAVANERHEKNELSKQLIQLQAKYDLQSDQVNILETKYRNIVNTTGVTEEGANLLVDQNKTLEEINKRLRDEVSHIRDEVEKARREKVEAVKSMKQLDEQNKQLKISVRALTSSGGMMTGNSSLPPINYQGKGMLMPVFGNGSYGISTTAFSLASRLASNNNKVVVIDFDILCPKLDHKVKMAPTCNLTSVNANHNTALGILYNMGIDFMIQNMNGIVKRVKSTSKGGFIDYISGAYGNVDALKIATTDYSRLLTYFGNNYNYVVMDMGRLGCSDIADKLIKTISDVAYRNVIVTNSSALEARSFRIKLDLNKINLANSAWLINMCIDTKEEDRRKKFILPAKYGTVRYESDMVLNKAVDFNEISSIRKMFSSFVDTSIFG